MSQVIQKAIADYIATFEQETVPPGWYSVKQLSDVHGTGRRNVFLILQKLMKFQQAERRDFRIKTDRGLQRIPHYKLSQGAAKAFGLTNRKR